MRWEREKEASFYVYAESANIQLDHGNARHQRTPYHLIVVYTSHIAVSGEIQMHI